MPITDEDAKKWADGVDKDAKDKIMKGNIRKFEDIFLGVGAEVLSFVRFEVGEGIEVEEWVYKGRKFFKDTENTVYANNEGEIGDPIGVYDPLKNVVKKLPAA